MQQLIDEIKGCKICEEHVPLGCRPVFTAHSDAKIAIIGQAPGIKVYASGIPWDDASGKTLRNWLQMKSEVFYDHTKVAIVPMGFCYPGKGKGGDLPPRLECAPQWHQPLFDQMPNIQLILLIGQYAQRYYLGNSMKENLTETVKNYQEYLPRYFPLPHPSPRNRFWFSKNPWFEEEVLGELNKALRVG